MSMRSSGTGSAGGFSLIELLVAIVLLGIVLVTLGGLSFRTARMSLDVSNSGGRQAVGLALVNHLTTVDYDSLPLMVGCDTVSVGPAGYRRCVALTSAYRRSDLTVTVTPLRPGSFPGTIQFSRVQKPRPNPLNTP
ncbi:MAG TPA: prepilin-type N-terminal cleavage/methylation domain-containing protein [Longimicrobiales bacterium]|nr:prepilin-type N-terminal cleavage/methylation domain-containing protein [Longimicrobiales bacterium]